MKKTFLVFLVAILAIVGLISSVAATGTFNLTLKDVKIDGVSVSTSDVISGFAGETIPIKVTFLAGEDASDVRIKAEVVGDREEISSKTDRFNTLAGSIYSETFTLTLPSDIDPSEDFTLKVSVYNKDKEFDESYTLKMQRASYDVGVLSADFDREVEAGSNLAISIVLKNIGYERLDDLYVIARIPELGVEKRAYFEDLTPVDSEEDSNPNNDDSERRDSFERRMDLKIPQLAEEGIYEVEVVAYNADAETKLTKNVAVIGTKTISDVMVPVSVKEIASGETAVYDVIIVNRGNSLGVYELVPETAENLLVTMDESIITVPADSSRTVQVKVKAGKTEGTYSFAINVNSDGKLVEKATLTANVTGNIVGTTSNVAILTVILAIIFVVLLIVLIVLLTRKPSKSEETEESYY